MKIACSLASLFLLAAHTATCTEPFELEVLRNSYQTAVARSVKPLSETYLAELKKMRDTFTKSGKLDEANAVQAEITAMTEKLNAAAAGGAIAMGAGQLTILETAAVIPANSTAGFKLPPLRKGDLITLSYVSGKWKCDGNIASDDPDAQVTERGDRTRLVLAEGPKNNNKSPGNIIRMVPGGTKDKPFTYVVQTTRDDAILRIHSGSENPKSPGAVTYTVKIVR